MTSEHTGVSVSKDVSRQSSNSDISTTQQGWHDDLMTAMLAEGLTHSRRTVTHITPLRDRIKSIAANSRRRNDYGGTFTPATVTASTGPTIFDYSAAHFDREGDSAEQPTLANRPIDQEYTSAAGKKTWGEAVYTVGYEREVLDTQDYLISINNKADCAVRLVYMRQCMIYSARTFVPSWRRLQGGY